jgi:nitrogen fixation NifU-like protein
MTDQSLYKETLLHHFRHPHNRCEGVLEGADIVRRGDNPRCGDEVEVGVYLRDGLLAQVKFRGRGCSVCIASSSMMTGAVEGRSIKEARRLCADMQAWFQKGGGVQLAEPPEDLQALSAVRDYPARRRCVLLSWEALDDALASTNGDNR